MEEEVIQKNPAKKATQRRGKAQPAKETSVVAEKRVFANEAIYIAYVEITAILWGSAMVVIFYTNQQPWVKTTISGLLIFVAMLCPSALLIRKKWLETDNLTLDIKVKLSSLSRGYLLILSDFGWKMFSYGVISLFPALFADLIGLKTAKLEESPSLVIVLLVHFFFIALMLLYMHSAARKERDLQ